MRTVFRTISFLVIGAFLSLSSTASNFTNAGTNTTYTLFSGDTLRITSGTYQGNLPVFTNGAVVIVSATAIFKPGIITNPAGKIVNYGTCLFNSMATYSGFAFTNNGLLSVSGSVSLYDGTKQTWTNNVTATINIGGSLSMNNADFTNWATVTVGGNVNLYTATSVITNAGLFSVGDDINMSNGIINNLNRLSMDVFNGWGGTINNQGEIAPKGTIVIPSGSNSTNTCRLIAEEGFTNYGNFTNNGLLWVGATNGNSETFTNGGTFTNAANAVVRTENLTNWATLAGAGGYYITGTSVTSGNVGRSGPTTDTIKVYDVTRTSPTRIFDMQWGNVYNNVVYRPFAEPNVAEVTYSGCSEYYRTDLAVLLPVEWKSFDAKLVGNTAVVSWSAEGDALKYEVERSDDNSAFVSVGTVQANASKTYSFTDAAVRRNGVAYYRVKAVGSNNGLRYTETKMVKMEATTASTSLSIYPNPVRNGATLSFAAQNNSTVSIVVKNVSGQAVITKTVAAVKGENNVALPESGTLKAGVYFIQLMDGTHTISERFIKH